MCILDSLAAPPLVKLLKLLLLEGSRVGKGNTDFVSSELGVGVDHGIELIANKVLVEGVKVDNLRAASGLADLLASCNDPGWQATILKDSLVHGLQCAISGALLRGMLLLSLGFNRSVDNDDYGLFKFVFEMLNDFRGDLAVEVRDSDKEVLSRVVYGTLIHNLLYGVD